MARSIWQKTITDEQGNLQTDVQVTVRSQSDNELSTIYADQSGGAQLSNPFNTGASSLAKFFAEPGFYKVSVFKNGDTAEFQWNNVGDNRFREDIAKPDSSVIIGGVDLKKRAIHVDTVADAKALNAPIGTKVVTAGYNSVGDSGGNDYIVVAGGTGTDDGGSFIDMDNGNQAKGLFPNGFVTPEQFGAKADVISDDYLPISSAIFYLENNIERINKLEFSASVYSVGNTLTISKNIYINGKGWYFLNDYIDDGLVVRGTIIRLITGSNCDLFEFIADISELQDSSFPRQHAIIKNLCAFGNRSGAQAPSVTDNNSVGTGFKFKGTSYITLDNVLALRCAEQGFEAQSFDYGDGNGLRSCNNFSWKNVVSIGNGLDGFRLFGGDSTLVQLVGGYNGRDGYNGNMLPVGISLFWNNKRRGVTAAGGSFDEVIGIRSYDNQETGIYIDGLVNGQIVDCITYSNGRGGSTSLNDSSGIFLAGDTDKITISGVTSGNKNFDTQRYGLASNVDSIDVTLGANNLNGNLVDNIQFSDYSGVKYHGGAESILIKHPGFTLSDRVNFNENDARNIRGLTFSNWGNTSVVAGVVDIGSRSLVTLDESSAVTVVGLTGVTDGIPYCIIRNNSAESVTFQHSNGGLRLSGSTDKVVAQYETITFAWVSGDVWQQVGS